MEEEKKDWRTKIKDMLIKVTLYQLGRYPAEKLERELTEFLKEAEDILCEAIRRNGGICYKEALEEYSPEEAIEYVEDQIKNFEQTAKVTGGKTEQIIADLLKLSLEFKDLDKMSLSNKVLLFDKVIHAEHAAGAFKEYLAEEKSIFGVNIPEIKKEADKELETILKGKKEAPDPPQDWRKEMAKAIGETFSKLSGIKIEQDEMVWVEEEGGHVIHFREPIEIRED